VQVSDRLRGLPYVELGLAAAVVLECAYLLAFSPFYTNDAALHLSSASGLAQTVGGFELGDRFLEWDPWPAPNLLATVLLSGLITVVGVDWGERLIQIGYVLTLPWAALYAVRAAGPGSGWLAYFALPLTFSLTFMYGFFNFSYSVVVFLLVAGFTLRTESTPSPRRTVGLALLLVLAFFTHFVGFLASGLLVVLLVGTRAVLLATERRACLVHGALAVAPSAALALVFVVSSHSEEVTTWTAPSLRLVVWIATMTWTVVSYDRLEIQLARLAAVAVWGLVVIALLRRRPWRERDPDTIALGLFVLVVFAVALLAPSEVESGGSLLSERLGLFPILGVMLWLSRQRMPAVTLVAGAAVAAVAAAGLLAVRYDELRQVEHAVDDLSALAGCVDERSTIVQANLADVSFGDARRINTLASEAGRLAVAREGLDLGNEEWGVPFSLQRFRPSASPFRHLFFPQRYIWEVPPPLDFRAFERTGNSVDYVLLHGRADMSDDTRRSDAFRRFDRSLRRRYRRSATSRRGQWELWSSEGEPCRSGDRAES
jgi:hypothetical protein